MARFSAQTPLIIGIDGRSGSGKTVLSRTLADNLSQHHSVTVVRLENMYPGWDGLARGIEIFGTKVLPALAAGETATFESWDWTSTATPEGGPGPHISIEPTDVIICEGVGVGARQNRALLNTLIWLRVPDNVRHQRAMKRDGNAHHNQWEQWAAQERELLDQDQIYDAADLVLVADEPDERHHNSALAVVQALLQR